MPVNMMSLCRYAVLFYVGLMLPGCGGGSTSGPAQIDIGQAPPIAPPTGELSVDTYAYIADSPYASVLEGCRYSTADPNTVCGHGELPYLGQVSGNPSIDEVMARVLVSHDWMGDNLRDVLQQMPADVLLLMRSVKSIVVAADVRPARFWVGRIYIDPEFLWLTPDEKNTIVEQDDFRSNFGDSLAFRIPHRYVRNGERLAIREFADGSRNISDLMPVLGVVLYHELAHALDQMPIERLPTLSPDDVPFYGPYLSSEWSVNFPMAGATPYEDLLLYRLAQVRYGGEEASDELRSVRPLDLMEPLGMQGATRFYSYSGQFEDFASAFETAMMEYHFGYRDEVAITDNLSDSVEHAAVFWGQRGRIGEQQVYVRILGVMRTIYPGDLDAVEAHIGGLPPAQDMPTGVSWSDSIEPGESEQQQKIATVTWKFDDILARRPIQ